ncbi:MAG: hypothetical protein K5917_04265 [Clostridiales bacterium]|nr:hypothetical protein [Clostridiales bacterium]
MAEIKYEITDELGILSENQKGWTKELNLVSWNDNKPKFDLREWAPDRSRMAKGITLNFEEAKALRDLLDKFDFDAEE